MAAASNGIDQEIRSGAIKLVAAVAVASGSKEPQTNSEGDEGEEGVERYGQPAADEDMEAKGEGSNMRQQREEKGVLRKAKKQEELDETSTWLQCESPTCSKWRRVKKADVPDGEWFCKDNKDPM